MEDAGSRGQTLEYLRQTGGAAVVNRPDLSVRRASQAGATEQNDDDATHQVTIARRVRCAGLRAYPAISLDEPRSHTNLADRDSIAVREVTVET
jgi:hypothetical protein